MSSESAPSKTASGSASPPRKRSWLRCGLIGLGVVGGGLILLAVLLPYLVPSDMIRDAIVAEVRARTGRECSIESLSVGLGGVTVRGMRVAGQSADAEPLLAIDSADIQANLLDLLSNRLDADAIIIQGVSLTVVRHADGSLSTDDLMGGSGGASSTSAPPSAAIAASAAAGGGASSDLQILLRSVQVRSAEFVFDDKSNGSRMSLNIPSVTVEGNDLNAAMTVKGSIASDSESSAGTIELSGTVDLIEDNAYDPNGTAELDIALHDLRPAGWLRILGVEVPGVDVQSATATGGVRVEWANQTPRVVARDLACAGLSIPAGEGAQPIKLPEVLLAGEATATSEGGAALKRVKLTAGFLHVNGNGTIVPGENGMDVKLPLTATADLAGLTQWYREAGMGEALPPGLAGRLVMEGTVEIRGDNLSLPLVVKEGEIRLPFGAAEKPLVIGLGGQAGMELTPDRFHVRAGLRDCTIDIPEHPALRACRAAVSALVLLDLTANRLEITGGRLESLGQPEGTQPWLWLGFSGVTETLTGDNPALDLLVDGSVEGEPLSELVRLSPFAEGARLDGRLLIKARCRAEAGGLTLSRLEEAHPILSTPPGEAARPMRVAHLVPDATPLSLGRIRVDSEALVWSSEKQTLQSKRIDVTIAGSRLVLVPDLSFGDEGNAEATVLAGTVGYSARLQREGLDPWLALFGLPLMPGPTTTLAGSASVRMGGEKKAGWDLVLGSTRLQTTVPAGGGHLSLSASHDMSCSVRPGGASKIVLGENEVSLDSGDGDASQVLARLTCAKDLTVSFSGQTTEVKGAVSLDAQAAALPSLLAAMGQGAVGTAVKELQPRGHVVLSSRLASDGQGTQAGISLTWSRARLTSGTSPLLDTTEVRGSGVAQISADGSRIDLQIADLSLGKALTMKGSLPLQRQAGEGGAQGYQFGEKASLVVRIPEALAFGVAVPVASPAGYALGGAATVHLKPSGWVHELSRIPFVVQPEDLSLREAQTSGAEPAPPSLLVPSGQMAGVLDLSPSMDSTGAQPATSLAAINIRDGVLRDVVLGAGGVSVKKANSRFGLSAGVLDLTGLVAEFGAGRMQGGRGRIDFRPEKPACRFEVQLQEVDLAEAFGQMEGFGQFDKGMLHAPSSEVTGAVNRVLDRLEKTETSFLKEEVARARSGIAASGLDLANVGNQAMALAWTGLDTDSFMSTCQIHNGVMYAGDVAMTGVEIESLFVQVAMALGGKRGRRVSGKTESVFGVAYASKPGEIVVPLLYVEGRDGADGVADFLVRGTIKQGNLDLRVFAVDHISRFIEPNQLQREAMTALSQLLGLAGGKEGEAPKSIGDVLDEIGRDGLIGFKLAGRYDQPRPEGLEKLIVNVSREVLNRSGSSRDGERDAGESIEDKLKGILKGEKDAEEMGKKVEDAFKGLFGK